MMPARDLIRAEDLGFALGLLTRLPVPVDGARAAARGAAAAWAWPLAGLAIAALAALAAEIALRLGLGPVIAAILAVATQIVVTGALHEDGLADSADGLWGGHDPVRRLEIMKDSRIGSYGVIALVLSLALRVATLAALAAAGAPWAALLAAAALGRAGMAGLMAALPPARSHGLARSVGRPAPATAALAGALALLAALALLGPGPALAAGLVAGIVTLLWGRLARARIGGQTGDILGASQQLSEIAVLLVLTALL